ncbi:serine hydrolase domain-containing protein [Streptosporangium sp. OZ121]|uniref:serine hydrolase domain-containing protein n=1 Tax=Streptosporangium sp. OZ121 TaxID=3444183 RepID=UPI003F7936A5
MDATDHGPPTNRRSMLKASLMSGAAMLLGGGCTTEEAPRSRGGRPTASDPVRGSTAPGFEPVRAAFAENFRRNGEVGAACCVYLAGREVVNLWGGTADRTTGRAWERETLIPVFSTTKIATAVCAHLLVERGRLDLDGPVAKHWPEFGAAGKKDIPLSWLLSHRCGLPALERPFSMADVQAWDPIVEALARQRPAWKPGTAHGYHARTFGWLIGELVRRVTGRPLATYFAEEVARPLGLDFWIGLPGELERRVGRLIPPEPPAGLDPATLPAPLRRMLAARSDPGSLSSRALTWPELDDNSRAVHAAEIPGHNGIATARSLARLCAALVGEVDGVRLLPPRTVEAAIRTRSDGPDRVLFVDTRFGLGFMLHSPFSPFGGTGRFGHTGSGGALAFADPRTGVALGYVVNRMAPGLLGPDPRHTALIEALRRCLP